MQETPSSFLGGEDPLEKGWGTYFSILGLLCGSDVKNLPAVQETGIRCLGWEDILENRKATPLQYSGLENSMDCIVHGVAKSWTRLSNFHFTSLHSPFSLTLGKQILFFASISLPVLDILYKWNHTVFVIL